MKPAKFQVVFKGAAVDDGAIDVAALAPALLGLGDLCEAANISANGESRKSTVRIRAVRPGSFEVDLDLAVKLAQGIRDFLQSDNYYAGKELLTIIFGGTSLFGLVRWLKGKKPDDVDEADAKQVIIMKDNAQITVNKTVFKLYQDESARKAIADMVAPLDEDGMDSISILQDGKVVESVTQQEANIFGVDGIDNGLELLSEGENEGFVEVVSPSFLIGLKWKLREGAGAVFWAEVHPDVFAEKVEQEKVSFSKGTVMKVVMKTTQSRKLDGSLVTDKMIVKILDVLPPPMQNGLFE